MKLNGQYLTSIRYLAICGGGLLAFILMGIVPNQLALQRIDTNLAALKKQLAEQEALFPIFNEMMSKIQKRPQQVPPLANREALPKGDTNRPTQDLKALAAQYRLRLEGIAPDLGNLIDGAEYLRLKATVKGNLKDFQPFLMDVGKLGYLGALETVRIRAADNERELFVQFTVIQKK